MNNDICNELIRCRAERFTNWNRSDVTSLVIEAMNRVSPGAIHGLQGVDAQSDGMTQTAWENAVLSAENCGALAFGYAAMDPVMPDDPVTINEALNYVADRVAESILTLHGYEFVTRKTGITTSTSIELPRNKRLLGVVTFQRHPDEVDVYTIVANHDREGSTEVYVNGEPDSDWETDAEAWREVFRVTGWLRNLSEALR